MSTVIGLVGGPGVGKSTMAAYLFFLLKEKQLNAEMVREYVKDWAWDGRAVKPYQQQYVAAKHIDKEARLLGKADYIITDYPVLLSIYYANKYAPPILARGVKEQVTAYYEQARSEGHEFWFVYTPRIHPYVAEGRYQTEEQAIAMDGEMSKLAFDEGTAFGTYTTAAPSRLGMELLVKCIEAMKDFKPGSGGCCL